MEKAHHDVFNILLQVLDDGRLTDGQGRTVDFRNAVIVMTSNLGSQLIQEYSGQNYEEMKIAVMEVVRQHFRPEFINRIDDNVVFHALGKEQIREIANIQIQSIQQRLKERNFKLELTTNALDYLASVGYDPVYGARPLKRSLQQLLENPLAENILRGEFIPGDTIFVDRKNDKLEFLRHSA